MNHLRHVLAVSAITVASLVAPVQAEEPHPIVLEIYEGFQRGELDRWDAVVDQNVITNSSAQFGTEGLNALKGWAGEFLTAFAPRIDLVDHINAVNEEGNGRAVLSINLNWQHVETFFGVLQPTGRTGTSIENLIMTIKDGKVTRIEVADTTLDLVIYMHENGWTFPQNIQPEPIIRGIERETKSSAISLQP